MVHDERQSEGLVTMSAIPGQVDRKGLRNQSSMLQSARAGDKVKSTVAGSTPVQQVSRLPAGWMAHLKPGEEDLVRLE